MNKVSYMNILTPVFIYLRYKISLPYIYLVTETHCPPYEMTDHAVNISLPAALTKPSIYNTTLSFDCDLGFKHGLTAVVAVCDVITRDWTPKINCIRM